MRKINTPDNTFNLYIFMYTFKQIKLRISYDEKYLLLGSNAVYFRYKVTDVSEELYSACLLPEDGGSTFLRISRELLQRYNPEVTSVITSDPTSYVTSYGGGSEYCLYSSDISEER
jgi:hypothetical protein